MATAHNTTRLVIKQVEEPAVVLTLSVEEAAFLASVMGMVGGDPTNSPRRYQQPIEDALRSAGFHWDEPGNPAAWIHAHREPARSAIYFQKFMSDEMADLL